MSLVNNGKLTIPLYHGTSTLFIDSIMDKGLGAIDPLPELDARAFCSKIFELCERYFSQDEKWHKYRKLIEAIVHQQVIDGNLNYRHGQTYLAPDPELAKSYACGHEHGSEFLTYSILMYRLLKDKNVADISGFNSSPMMGLLHGTYHPILLSLYNVKIEDIITETDCSMGQQLEEIEGYMKKGLFPPRSFKLKVPIYKDNFTVTEITC